MGTPARSPARALESAAMASAPARERLPTAAPLCTRPATAAPLTRMATVGNVSARSPHHAATRGRRPGRPQRARRDARRPRN